jgi:hypothetical protein
MSSKSMGPQIANPEITNLQITKNIGSAHRKSAQCHICGRYANYTNYLTNLRICDLQNLFADTFGIS